MDQIEPSEWKWTRDSDGNVRLEGTSLVFRDADTSVSKPFDINGSLANLLSAAPLLLAACQYLIEAIEDDDYDSEDDWVTDGRAAIAMATCERTQIDLATFKVARQAMMHYGMRVKRDWPELQQL